MSFLSNFWNYLTLSAPFLIFGLLIAGVVHVYLSVETIKKFLGKSSLKSITLASFYGVPLPLCSCSVIPTAVTLKKSGAKNAEVSSFLISTPESGVDSIMMTYAMMDFPMTVIRPLAAFLSAVIAGIMQMFFNNEDEQNFQEEEKTSCCNKACSSEVKEVPFMKKIVQFAFVELLDDIVLWLSFGLILGGVIDYFLPASFFVNFNGTLGRISLLFIGIPLYVCASASTPIAAAMVAKGMSPGVALIFLLVGPATNISNIAVLQKYIGKKGIVLNLLTLSVVSLIFSYVTDYLYESFQWPLNFRISHEHDHISWWLQGLTILFCLLLLLSLAREFKKRFL